MNKQIYTWKYTILHILNLWYNLSFIYYTYENPWKKGSSGIEFLTTNEWTLTKWQKVQLANSKYI